MCIFFFNEKANLKKLQVTYPRKEEVRDKCDSRSSSLPNNEKSTSGHDSIRHVLTIHSQLGEVINNTIN